MSAGPAGHTNRQQLFHWPEPPITVLFAGRLDNRAEILRQAPDPLRAKAAWNDSRAVLVAYLRLGVDFPTALLGDFIVVIWDGAKRQLICARDIIGVVPFYYSISSNTFVFASSPAWLHRCPSVSRTPNPGMIAEYLALSPTSMDETLFEDVQRLPPAHVLVIDERSTRLSRYWDIAAVAARPRHLVVDYFDEFRALLFASVTDRLDGAKQPSASLSGGLDSSSVVGVASSVLSEAGNRHRRLKTFSLTHPGLPCDEAEYIESVTKAHAVDAYVLPWSDFDHPDWPADAAEQMDIPEYPTLTEHATLLRLAVERGSDILLTGEGGDTWLAGSYYPFLSMWCDGRKRHILEELRFQQRSDGIRWALIRLLRGLSWPLIPAGLRLRYEQKRPHRLDNTFLSETFARRVDLQDRLSRHGFADRFSDIADWDLARVGSHGTTPHFMELIARLSNRCGIEIRHPLHDRRIIELMLAMPDYMKRDQVHNRLLLRRMGPHLLPDRIARRDKFTEFGAVYAKALSTPQVRDVLSSERCRRRNWVRQLSEEDRLDHVLDQYTRGHSQAPQKLIAYWMLYAIETWYTACVD